MKEFCFLFCILYMLGIDTARSQSFIKIESDRELVRVGMNVSCFVDSSANFSVYDAISNFHKGNFYLSNQAVPNIGISTAALWLYFKISNSSVQQCYLEIANNGLDSISLFEVRNDSLVGEKKSGVGLVWKDRELRNNNYHFLLCEANETSKEFYLRVRHSRGTFLPMTVGTLKGYAEKFHKEDFMMGIYFGFMVLMILYNLFIFFSVKDLSYIYYVIYVFFMALMNASLSGFAHEYVWGPHTWIGQYEDVISSLLGISGILFAMHFLHTKKNALFIHYLFIGLLVSFSLGIIVVVSGHFMMGTIYVEINALILICTFFIAAFQVMLKGYRPARFFLFAWSALLCSVVLFVLKDFNVLPYNTLTGHSLKFGSAIEALLLLFALANKLNTIRKEKEEAQLSLVQQLQDNERIIQTQNIMLERKVEERTVELALEKKKTEQLLMNILPEETAKELIKNGMAKAKRFEEVTVMFTDFQNFTSTSEQLDPEELVQELNNYYTVFDTIISQYGIEKIKTIGDSYMCASGLPLENAAHAEVVVKAAIEIQQFIVSNKKRSSAIGARYFDLRIGVHTGPVVAGIIGYKKFAYDIWGDTVNIASRMESSGEIGKVNISGATYAQVKDKFNCTYRGKIEAKHKGEIDMYFIEP